MPAANTEYPQGTICSINNYTIKYKLDNWEKIANILSTVYDICLQMSKKMEKTGHMDLEGEFLFPKRLHKWSWTKAYLKKSCQLM